MVKGLLRASLIGLSGLLVATCSWAGPNANGTLVVGLSEGTVYTTDISDYCGSATASSCDALVASTTADGAVVLNVLAAFPAAANPRLAGITFGVDYVNGQGFGFAGGASCGDFELPEGSWPDPGSGTAVTWASAQTGLLSEVYWFAVYSYDSYGPGDFCLTPNPIQGGNFADDDTPSNVDAVAGYGCFGFHGGNSQVPCPEAEAAGACCLPDGSCELLLEADCELAGGTPGFGPSCNPNPCPQPALGACCISDDCVIRTEVDCIDLGGQYAGDDTTCENTDCGAIPTDTVTWGRVKGSYR